MHGINPIGETDMKQKTRTEDYGFDQYRRDCFASRRKLGITSNKMTVEQKKIYQGTERIRRG